MSSNFLITGPPGCGKTTLIKAVAAEIKTRPAGFYTEEIRGDHGREGFRIVLPDGRNCILAHKNQTSPFRVGKYGVDIKLFDEVIDKERLNISKSPLVIIDEIGKMELFSSNFRKLIMEILKSERALIATIMYRSHTLADKIKGRKDIELLELKRNNFEIIKEQVVNYLKSKDIY